LTKAAQIEDRYCEESISMTEDRDKWRKYTSMVWPTLGSRMAKNKTELEWQSRVNSQL